MDQQSKEMAIDLRKRGYSYGYISEKLKISRSTLSYWIKNVIYKPNGTTLKRIADAREKTIIFKKNKKIEAIKLSKEKADKFLGKISKRDLFLTGIGLYWGEGRKTDESVVMTNSDPGIIKFFINWLRNFCQISPDNLKAEVHLYPDNDIIKSKNYWMKITGLKKDQFYKTQVDRRINKRKKRTMLPYGTIHIYMRSGGNGVRNTYRMIKTWIDKIAGVAQW